jgi:histidinol dehydrogenase
MTRTYLKKGASASPAQPSPSSPTDVPGIVKGVIDNIRSEGDAAVRRYSEKFDRWTPASFKLSQTEIEEAIAQVPAQIIADIKTVQANVRKFALAQKESLKEFEMEMAPGVWLGQRNNPIEVVGA